MSRTTQYEKAQERADVLWEYHKEHKRLLLADVERLTGQSRTTVYRSFKVHNISAPTIWDSRKEKTRRKAKLLVDMAKSSGQDILTEYQAATVLGVKESSMHMILQQIDKHGFYIPEVIGHENYQTTEEKIKYKVPRIYETYYPTGLQVLDSRPGPNGTIIYRLR